MYQIKTSLVRSPLTHTIDERDEKTSLTRAMKNTRTIFCERDEDNASRSHSFASIDVHSLRNARVCYSPISPLCAITYVRMWRKTSSGWKCTSLHASRKRENRYSSRERGGIVSSCMLDSSSRLPDDECRSFSHPVLVQLG